MAGDGIPQPNPHLVLPMKLFDPDPSVEQQARKTLTDGNLFHLTIVCDAHRTGARPRWEQTIIATTALLPLCQDCCLSTYHIDSNNTFPFDLCSCATQIVHSKCWLCMLEGMENIKARTCLERVKVEPGWKGPTLLCGCGKDMRGEISGSTVEKVRSCACCDGLVTLESKNFAGDQLVFERLGNGVKNVIKAFPRLSYGPSATTVGDDNVDANTTSRANEPSILMQGSEKSALGWPGKSMGSPLELKPLKLNPYPSSFPTLSSNQTMSALQPSRRLLVTAFQPTKVWEPPALVVSTTQRLSHLRRCKSRTQHASMPQLHRASLRRQVTILYHLRVLKAQHHEQERHHVSDHPTRTSTTSVRRHSEHMLRSQLTF